MKMYWPLALMVCVLGAILGMSQYVDSAKQKYEERHKQVETTAVAKDYKGKTADNEQETYKPPVWSKYVTFPEGLGAWAVVLTLLAIVWQSIETRKAAQAARNSIRLQEAGMRQWVNVNPIRIGIPPALTNPCQVSLQFEIVNCTEHMMTILRVESSMSDNVHTSEDSDVDANFLLVPQNRDPNSRFPFSESILVDIGELSDTGKIFIVTGTVTYLDCMESRRTQVFQDLYMGFVDGRLERMKPVSIS